ncbi:RING finger protein 11 isoform X3 [Bactrocera neohumeralis]|uniref:RING finger protein 11 n=1 Tax=Bactrocera tryoni TaxID=59916 RepID=UPI001A96457F|nr:RING finger protein 11 [Bactrocera tryoni]XP_039967714.1 RING finger protein 11 [Bactrocera tryoni]XP_039967715.1 RING finger protein 11 [Bactrocera tryoni]XP_039967716.1 RING finger protein 11 [Bactrocera tryoni]XP_039967717.1 RING finger protein 11 [Bactrocera tryoni]XP_039967719.1 RING finger protein 11 [Bactrocera tryoni]XP_050339615.1 RING finger protein 11 isoform X3 [Bactrocera neohumeralis]
MGNCLQINSTDDISLLRGSESSNTHDFTSDRNVPAPIYSELLQPVFFPSLSTRRPASNLTEEEQVKIAKRIGLIQHLPIGTYDGSKKIRECVICMIDFCVDEAVRYLPCMHIYHVHCIDDWLMRSLTCPSCMEPVDAALLTSYETS